MDLKVDVPQVQVLFDDEIKMRRWLSSLKILVVESFLDIEIVLFLELETSLQEILFQVLFDITLVLFNVRPQILRAHVLNLGEGLKFGILMLLALVV